MAEELSYVIVTPYSIRKSRTGGIIARLLSRTGLDIVSGTMFAPSRELIDKYCKSIVTEDNPRHRATQELIRQYMLKHLAPDASGQRARALFMVFRGEDATAKIMRTVGHIVNERTSGETIRDTYGDYITGPNGEVTYFEPAVVAPPDPAAAARDLQLWASYADTDSGLLENVLAFPKGETVEKTLVLIKPDNFAFPNIRPGGVIDVFSRTGLYIIGFKVLRMSVAQAAEFYGPVLEVLMQKLKDSSGVRARLAIERELGMPLAADVEKKLGEILGPIAGRYNWESIVQFMAGLRSSDCPSGQREEPGTQKCIALVYQGVEAVRKIRDVLGPTDPSKAPPGSIRKEFGQTIMVNAAHASDSAENAAREMKIVRITENNFKPLIENYFGSH